MERSHRPFNVVSVTINPCVSIRRRFPCGDPPRSGSAPMFGSIIPGAPGNCNVRTATGAVPALLDIRPLHLLRRSPLPRRSPRGTGQL
jgi:hypothetical protein